MDSAEDIEAARKVYFGFYNPMDNWTWNISWFSDPVFRSLSKRGTGKVQRVSAGNHRGRYAADPSATGLYGTEHI